MRVLCTGVAGMFASNLARLLADQGHDVYGVDDLSRGRRELVDPRITFYEQDLTIKTTVHIPRSYDAVYHCAALVGGVEHVRTNGWRNIKNSAIDYSVIEFCVRTGTPLVYSSSCTVYPPWINFRPLKEEDCASCGGPNERGYKPDEGCYGMAKLLGEMAIQEAVREHGLRAVITRCFNIYGPNEIPSGTAHVIPALIGKVLRKELPLEVWGDGSQQRSYLYVDDAARGIIAAMENGKPGEVYNLGTEQSHTVNELAGMILERCGYDKSALRNDPSKPSGVSARYADISKAKRELGWEPTTSIATGLDKTVQWCREWMERR